MPDKWLPGITPASNLLVINPLYVHLVNKSLYIIMIIYWYFVEKQRLYAGEEINMRFENNTGPHMYISETIQRNEGCIFAQ